MAVVEPKEMTVTVPLFALISILAVAVVVLWRRQWLKSEAGIEWRIEKAKQRAVSNRIHQKAIAIAEQLGSRAEYKNSRAYSGLRFDLMADVYDRDGLQIVSVGVHGEESYGKLTEVYARLLPGQPLEGVFRAVSGYLVMDTIFSFRSGDWERQVEELSRLAEIRRAEKIENDRKEAIEEKHREFEREKRKFGL